ncbi:ABC transporter permease subunit [Bradyrhizobium japonicum]
MAANATLALNASACCRRARLLIVSPDSRDDLARRQAELHSSPCPDFRSQLFLFYALPDIGIRLTPFETSWLALALWGGAYQTEVFRAAFEAVPKGEVTAARALGLPAFQTFLDITLPIALRIAITGTTTTAITQFRSSSFMIVVGYQELTYVANRIVSDTFKVFETFGIACLMYLLGCSIISALSRTFERRLAVPGLGVVK